MRLLFFFIAFLTYSKCSAQNDLDDGKAIAVLREFYAAHAHIEASIRTLPPKVYVWKSDSIKKKYCALKLMSIIKKSDENGIDFLTKDRGIDIKSLKTMTIVKDQKNKNVYVVSYDCLVKNYPKAPTMKHVILNIALIIEDGNYKINSVQ